MIVPELLAGIELGVVGWQIDDPDPLRQPCIPIAQVEPGLVADDDVNRVRVGQGQVLQIAVIPELVDRRDLAEVRLTCTSSEL